MDNNEPASRDELRAFLWPSMRDAWRQECAGNKVSAIDAKIVDAQRARDLSDARAFSDFIDDELVSLYVKYAGPSTSGTPMLDPERAMRTLQREGEHEA